MQKKMSYVLLIKSHHLSSIYLFGNTCLCLFARDFRALATRWFSTVWGYLPNGQSARCFAGFVIGDRQIVPGVFRVGGSSIAELEPAVSVGVLFYAAVLCLVLLGFVFLPAKASGYGGNSKVAGIGGASDHFGQLLFQSLALKGHAIGRLLCSCFSVPGNGRTYSLFS